MTKVQESDLQEALQPEMITLDGLMVAAFRLMKLVPAEYILRRAAKEGLLPPGGLIIESTSGGFGQGLAMVCNARDYRFIMVSDPVVDEWLNGLLTDLGAEVQIVCKTADVASVQRARLDRVAELLERHPEAYWPRQYDNPWNAEAYHEVGEKFADELGKIDILIGSIGTGGSMCGLVPVLRKRFPDLVAVGIDTYGSVLFGQPNRSRWLRGLGNSVMPAVIDHRLFDDFHWISAHEAFLATRILNRETGMFRGPTSGAVRMVADWYARRHPGARILTLFADEGDRYATTTGNEAWLKEHDVWTEELPAEPEGVAHPHEARDCWTRLPWKRRSLKEVLNGDPA